MEFLKSYFRAFKPRDDGITISCCNPECTMPVEAGAVYDAGLGIVAHENIVCKAEAEDQLSAFEFPRWKRDDSLRKVLRLYRKGKLRQSPGYYESSFFDRAMEVIVDFLGLESSDY